MTGKLLKKATPFADSGASAGHEVDRAEAVKRAIKSARILETAAVNSFSKRMKNNPNLVTLTTGLATNPCWTDIPFPY